MAILDYHAFLFKFHEMGPKCISNNVWRDLRLPILAFAMVARNIFNGKFTAKIEFPIKTFYATTADADTGSQKSPHTLFDKYLDHRLVKFN